MTVNDKELRKAVMHETRVQSLLDVFGRTNSVLLGRRVPIKAVNTSGANGAPAWSTRDAIFINRDMFSDLRVETLAKLLGLNYHEACHIMYTPQHEAFKPRAGIRPRHMQGMSDVRHTLPDGTTTTVNGIGPAYNALEDQRIETLFSNKYPNAKPYFAQAVYEILLGNAHLTEHAWPVVYGRKFIDPDVRALFRSAYKAQNHLAELEAVIDEYCTLPIHHLDAVGRIKEDIRVRALDLIAHYAYLLNGENVSPPAPCAGGTSCSSGKPTEEGEPVPTNQEGDNNDTKENSDDTSEGQGEGSAESEDDSTEGDASGGKSGDDESDSDGDGAASGDGTEDAESDQSGDADTGLGEGDGDGSGSTSGEDNQDGKAAGNGQGDSGSNIDPKKAAQDAVRDALNDAKHEQQASKELSDLQASVQRGSKPDLDVLPRVPMAEVMTASRKTKATLSAKKVSRELSELRTELEEGWLEDQSTGVLNTNAARRRNANPREVFKTWEDSHIDSTKIEVVIAVDISSSMRGSANELSDAVFTLKQSFDSVGATVTVLAFNVKPHLIYKPDERAVPKQIGIGGGTDPSEAIAIAKRIYAQSDAHTKLFLCLTDGSWGMLSDHIINELNALRALGAYRQLFEYKTTGHLYADYFDGAAPIAELTDFVKTSKALVKQLMKRV